MLHSGLPVFNYKTRLHCKCYTKYKYPTFAMALQGFSKRPAIFRPKIFSDSPGCLRSGPTESISVAGTKAEMIPVEPDQGNACAGKVAVFYSPSFAVFTWSID